LRIPLESPACDHDHPTPSKAVAGGIPDAWPILLGREQLSAFLAISPDTVARICPVAPVDLGVRLLRWRRADIEAWVSGMPLRPRLGDLTVQFLPPGELAGDERRAGAVERARLRASGVRDKTTWH
jgi:hypothetical protein